MSRPHLLLFALLAACTSETEPEPSKTPGTSTDTTSGTVTEHGDVDADGLDAAFEHEIGTSDTAADSDLDGCSDTVEVLGYFDPLDAEDRPYTGGYPRGPRAGDAVFDALAAEHGEAFEEGSLNPNWSLVDQNGEVVELYDFFGQVVLVDLASEWCVPCQQASPELNEFYLQKKAEGFVILQLMLEGVENNSEPQAQRWIEGTGVTFPVLVDYSPGDYTVTEVAQYYLDVEGPSYDLPNFSVLNRELVVQRLYVNDEFPDYRAYEAMLAEPAPQVDVRLPDNADALRVSLGMEAGSWVTPASLCDVEG